MAHLENAGNPSPAKPLDSRVTRPWGIRPWSLEQSLPLLITGAFLTLWETATRTAIISPLFFPAPTTILLTAQRLVSSGELFIDLNATLTRILIGFACGASLGLVLGFAMGWSDRLRVVVDPFIAAGHSLPKISILPLLMLVFGIGETSKIVLIAVGTFFPMLINAMTGVRQISPIHFEVAQNYGASTMKLFTRVIAPGALPLVLTGIRLAFNIALLLTIAVEIASAKEGLGARIWLSWQTFRIEQLYVTLFEIALLGFGFNLGLERLADRIVPWRTAREF